MPHLESAPSFFFAFAVLVLPLSPVRAQTDGGSDVLARKRAGFDWVDGAAERLRRTHRLIWEAAEVGLEETRSSAALSALLEENGFAVERGVSGMPTAFVATWGKGRPVIAILAEYDALPGMSQEAAPERRPRVEGGAGHACGHSIFGTASVAGAIAARHALESSGLSATLRVYGTPAEETGIGKSYMVLDGRFDDCDVALHWHPGYSSNVSFSTSKAVVSVKIRFEGLPAHASLSPHEGRSALDAIELTNIAANFLREHLAEDARIHYVITDGGGQPNVVPPRAEAWYYLRADDHRDVERMFERLKKIAQGAALMTDTRHTIAVDSDSHELLPNRPLSEVIQRNLELVGAPRFDEAEREFARRTQEPLVAARGEPLPRALADAVETLADAPDLIKASTDVGDVSQKVPTGGFRVASYTWGAPGHSWQIVACTGTSIGDKALAVAAKTMAASAIDLASDPRLVEAARADFEKRSAGKEFRSLIPKGQRPPAKIR